jgi:sulfur-oxidizing protein SoxY
MKRRLFLGLSGAALAGAALLARAQQILPAQDLAPMVAKITGGAPVRPGRVSLDLPALAENGNSVPFTLRVDSPMTAADHVKSVHVFAERNPRPLVAVFHLGPMSGRAVVSTRVRLAGTQRVLAVASLSDGTFWSGQMEVVVTSAACLDEAAS